MAQPKESGILAQEAEMPRLQTVEEKSKAQRGERVQLENPPGVRLLQDSVTESPYAKAVGKCWPQGGGPQQPDELRGVPSEHLRPGAARTELGALMQ